MRVLPLVLIIALCACSKGQTASATAQPAPAAGAALPAGAAPASAAAQAAAIPPVPAQLPEVVARVNGDAIGKAEFEKAVKAIEGQNRAHVPADQRDRIYRGLLDQIISFRLLIQESKARKVAVAEPDVDARIAQIRGQFPTQEAFIQALTQQGVTVDQLRADARSELQVTKMLQLETDGELVVKPEQVDASYKDNPDQFQRGERVRASHILIGFPQNADAAAKQAAKVMAEGVLGGIKAGKDFATLAKANSQDPGSAQNGGDLNFFERGQMVPSFDQAVFAMQRPGQISELVETQFGYHIIKLTEKQPGGPVALDDALRGQIKLHLENEARQAATQVFITALKAKGKVEILF